MPKVVIGLTGAFGSGCTTAARHLKAQRSFAVVRLSEPLRAKWEVAHPRTEPPRLELQRLGDEMRQAQGRSAVVEAALGSVAGDPEQLVVDGIRNTGEIEHLRDRYGYRFTLVSVLSSQEARWERIGEVAYTAKSLTELDFHQDDTRDRNEETPWGQEVELCIDQADVSIDNPDDLTLRNYRKKVLEFVDLITGAKPRPAKREEVLMHIAYGASHSSKCLKRHVGAVVVDPSGQVIGLGYNENPLTTNPCVEEPTYENRCFRDIVRNKHFKDLGERGVRCPKCGEPLSVITGPPWRCGSCATNGVKTNLEAFFFPDRAMNWCTAIHGEAWALTAAGERARGGTIYTTTFPCMQCSGKIVQAGIKEIWFTEAYPDSPSLERLTLGQVKINRFEGVRSASFERIFAATKPR